MYKSILVPIDTSEPGSWERAIPVALEMSRAFGARMHVMTVIRDADAIWEAQYSLMAYESMMAKAESRLAGIVEQMIPEDRHVTKSVAGGSIYAEILRTARDIGADLVVMASHRPQMKDYLIGANAARVARHAGCSVLIVRNA